MGHISVQEAAALLVCSDQYVGRLLKDGTLAGERRGRRWVVDEQSVATFIATRDAKRSRPDDELAPPSHAGAVEPDSTEPDEAQNQTPVEAQVRAASTLRTPQMHPTQRAGEPAGRATPRTGGPQTGETFEEVRAERDRLRSVVAHLTAALAELTAK